MDLRHITADYVVAPQIQPSNMGLLAAEGFTTVICNRPDAENPAELHMQEMQGAATAAGLAFVENPIGQSGLTMDIIETQASAIADAEGLVLAYCRTGNRSTIVWALSQAGRMPTDQMIAAAGRAGYDITGMRGQIEALASG